MKLYYFADESGNFGDDLNPWIWNYLLPEVLDQNGDEIFVGIGTLLNHRLPAIPIKHIFGSGLGYGRLPLVDEKFVFHAVRGFETAKALNLPASLVVTDSAVLIRELPIALKGKKDYRFGLMLTGHSLGNFDWEPLCHLLGFNYISCHWSVDSVLSELGRCDVLITEAMHGAIVADALRVPWIPIDCYGYVLDFKWKDWLSTIGIPYLPSRVTPLFDSKPETNIASRMRTIVKRTLKASGIWSHSWSPPPPERSSEGDYNQALRELESVAARPAFLSSDSIVESHTARYLDLLEKFRKEHRR